MQSKQRDSLQDSGVISFNLLPSPIRNITREVKDFKVKFDLLLDLVPEKPAVPGFVSGARTLYRKPSNSNVDRMRVINRSVFNQLMTNEGS